MNDRGVDLAVCDREPIHVPGSIQPHGVLLVADPESGLVRYGAGDVAGRVGRQDWLGLSAAELLGPAVSDAVGKEARGTLRQVRPPSAASTFDVSFHSSGGWHLLELEPASDAASGTTLLPLLEAAAAAFERAGDMRQLSAIAATEFRRLTGYDRVMVYRFLEDDAGVVVGEEVAAHERSFLNHHFPASDIPKQARALYVRNLVRVIPDVGYAPAPLTPAWREPEALDMSDCALRSVSPVHVQYLRNMGVAASASVSIVKDGALWGLVACHNASPRQLGPDVRAACRALAGGLSRQIKAREETDSYRERVRLRTFEDRHRRSAAARGLAQRRHLEPPRKNHEDARQRRGRGAARQRSGRRAAAARPSAEMREAGRLAGRQSSEASRPTRPVASRSLPASAGTNRAWPAASSPMTLSTTEPWVVVWFRAEQVQVVNWAGNPHKKMTQGPGGTLNPRASFDAWSETVRGERGAGPCRRSKRRDACAWR